MALSEARLKPSTVLPTAIAVAAGAGVAVQSYINGRLGVALGSPELAAAVNNTIGLLALTALVVATRALPRALRAVRAGAQVRWWYLIGGLGGSLLVASAAIAAPEIGVALLTVALVCGQTAGSLIADSAGLSPAGRAGATPLRIAGVVLAVAAVALSAFGARGHLDLLLLAFALVAGVAVALQQAANGQLARATGEPLVAGMINFVVGLAALLVLAGVVTSFHAPNGWSAPPLEWIGGLLGATIATTSAILVSRLGVLGLMIAVTAGQVTGGLVIDLVAPVKGEPVTVETVFGIVLAFVAVALTARDRRRREGV
ncbi:MAG: DMT family transporter [Solirubrobacteraceae bacterium]